MSQKKSKESEEDWTNSHSLGNSFVRNVVSSKFKEILNTDVFVEIGRNLLCSKGKENQP